ncbi:Alpha/Beta hydrolase protein [Roridomyces roridus]|uniref:Alpha/Beta hydrolase protein n=1 Tax=Roridomyces roridus TaxID=1738132 RepID=A0AAD7CJX8_9AGAR|nr:Alpha/Beta hydrolase protein [Roridomyces roridus]
MSSGPSRLSLNTPLDLTNGIDLRPRFRGYQVNLADGRIRVRTMIPNFNSAHNTYPLLVWFHATSGGTTATAGPAEQMAALCVEMNVVVVCVEYRLAHEHGAPLDDCYTALKWAAESPTHLSADLSKGFIVGGMSSGGHFTAVLVHQARDDAFFRDHPGRRITGHILRVPVSVQQASVSADDVSWYHTQLPSSSSQWPSHAHLPPTFIQVCGLDPAKDEGFLYEQLLRRDGVRTKIIAYPGLPHAFRYGFPQLASNSSWEDDLRLGLSWILDGGGS